MKKIECYIVQDLLPLYIGPLTVASLWAFRTEQHVWYSEETITIG